VTDEKICAANVCRAAESKEPGTETVDVVGGPMCRLVNARLSQTDQIAGE
jgi:hypothetical protein